MGGVEVDACGARFDSEARDRTPGRRVVRCLLGSAASAEAPGAEEFVETVPENRVIAIHQ